MPDFVLMGVVNVTPDSFSDGGRWLDPAAAVAHGRALAVEGAVIVDVGGESTRPGAEPVAAAVEAARVVPVVAGLADLDGVRVSVDTVKASVAEAALDAGATYVNDVSALRADRDLVGLVADRGCACCLMHMRGEPRTMQDAPRYTDVEDEVRAFVVERAAFSIANGVAAEKIHVDPGIGFGKTVEHNLQLLARLDEIVALGFPVMVGTSRKGFLGRLTGRTDPADRLAGTIATTVLAYARGARVFRVHDVAPARDALLVAAATLRAHDA